MRRSVGLIVAIIGGYLVYRLMFPPQPTPPALDLDPVAENAPAAPHPLATSLGADPAALHKEPAVVLELLNAWRRVDGRYPAAEDNAALIRQLTSTRGNRPPLLNPQHPRINAEGALTDGWGTPYFFHHISANYMEVRSAGPDRLLYTADDLVVPPARVESKTF
jgi:hypothetical protein